MQAKYVLVWKLKHVPVLFVPEKKSIFVPVQLTGRNRNLYKKDKPFLNEQRCH